VIELCVWWMVFPMGLVTGGGKIACLWCDCDLVNECGWFTRSVRLESAEDLRKNLISKPFPEEQL
jgi:hypothetical protein